MKLFKTLVLSTLIGVSINSIQPAKASYVFTAQDMKECVHEAEQSFIREYSKRGRTVRNPKLLKEAMTYYCECARTALETGDTLTDAVNFAAQATVSKYGHQF